MAKKKTEKMYRVFSQHGGSNIELPKMTVKGARGLARAAAELKTDSLYRLFAESNGVFQFQTAFSVIQGKVREHRDVTIPAYHW